LSNLTAHAVARHHLPACWQFSAASIKELRGRSALKRTKATLDDQELLDLIDAIETRNAGRANGLRVLTLYRLRPVLLAAGASAQGPAECKQSCRCSSHQYNAKFQSAVSLGYETNLSR
jgi:hypothetical protein